MNIDTTQITERVEEIDGEQVAWACYSYGEHYFEIPLATVESEDHLVSIIRDCIFNVKHREAMDAFFSKTSHSDDVYSEGQLVRQDRPLAQVDLTDEEQALVPGGAIDVVVGRYTGYRPPYSGSGLSIYDQRKPPESLLTSLGLTEDDFEGEIHPWYAVKRDDLTGNILYKLVQHYAVSHGGPIFPKMCIPIWTAKIYTPDGAVDNHVDFFIAASKESMEQWCEENGYVFPIPAEETGTPWCFGIVWDTETQQIVTLKGYIPRDQ